MQGLSALGVIRKGYFRDLIPAKGTHVPGPGPSIEAAAVMKTPLASGLLCADRPTESPGECVACDL